MERLLQGMPIMLFQALYKAERQSQSIDDCCKENLKFSYFWKRARLNMLQLLM